MVIGSKKGYKLILIPLNAGKTKDQIDVEDNIISTKWDHLSKMGIFSLSCLNQILRWLKGLIFEFRCDIYKINQQMCIFKQ